MLLSATIRENVPSNSFKNGIQCNKLGYVAIDCGANLCTCVLFSHYYFKEDMTVSFCLIDYYYLVNLTCFLPKHKSCFVPIHLHTQKIHYSK